MLSLTLASAPPAFAGPDDVFPGTPLTTSPLPGRLDRTFDEIDVYSIYLEAGQRFCPTLTGATDNSVELAIYAPDASAPLPGTYDAQAYATATTPARIGYTARSSGLHYVSARLTGGVGLDYSLAWTTAPGEADDEIPGVTGATDLVGAISGPQDGVDVYAIDLVAGVRTSITIETSGTGAASAALWVFGPGANSITGGGGLTAVSTGSDLIGTTQFTPAADGTHYFAVRGDTYSFNYHVSWRQHPPEPDDELPGIALPAPPVTAVFDGHGDIDVYAVELTAGQLFSVDVIAPGITSSYGYLYGPDTGDGSAPFAASSRNTNTGFGLSRVIMATGTYYLSLVNYGPAIDYSIVWATAGPEADDDIPGVPGTSPATGALSVSGDAVDVYAIPLTQGQRLQVTGSRTGGTLNGSMALYRPAATSITTSTAATGSFGITSGYLIYNVGATGTYYLAVSAAQYSGDYSLSWATTSNPDDQLPAATRTSPVSGSLTWPTDTDDVFGVSLTKGKRVVITANRTTGTASGTVRLYAPGSSSLESPVITSRSFSSSSASISYLPLETGTYYLRVSSSGTINYTVGWAISSETNDDIPGQALPASPVSATLNGTTDIDDVYSIVLAKGETLAWTVTSGSASGALRPPTATTITSGQALNATTVGTTRYVTAPEAGTYYLEISGSSAYTFTWSKITASPDNDIPGVSLPASPAPGTLDASDPVDVYALDLTAGQRLSLRPSAVTGSAPLVAVLPPTATALATTFRSNFAELGYLAPVDGTYFVCVTGSATPGEYQLAWSVTAEETDNVLPGVPLPISGTTGSVDRVDDPEDYFAIDLAQGETLDVVLSGVPENSLSIALLGTTEWGTTTLAYGARIDTAERLRYTADQAGTFSVQITAILPAATPYTLDWGVDTTPPVFDDVIPGTTLTPGTHIGHLEKATDWMSPYPEFDVYSIELRRGDTLEVMPASSPFWFDVSLLAPGVISAVGAPALTWGPPLRYTAPIDGIYHLVIMDGWTGLQMLYALDVRVTPALERPDIPGAPLVSSPATGSVSAYLPLTDDILAVGLRAGETFVASLTPTDATHIDTALYAPGATSVYEDAPTRFWLGTGTPQRMVYTATTTGTHYLRIAPYSGSGGWRLDWSIWKGEADDRAPGTPLAIPSLSSSLASEYDFDDIYYVEMNTGQTLSASVTGAAGTDYALSLYGPTTGSLDTTAPLASKASGGYPRSTSVTAPMNGTYYVRVRAAAGYGNYTLTSSVADPPVPPAEPTIVGMKPDDGSFISSAEETLSALVSGGALPLSIRFEYSLDDSATWEPIGTAVRTSDNFYGYTAWGFDTWDTTGLADGPVLVRAVVTDGLSRMGVGPAATVTADNTAPLTPSSLIGAAGQLSARLEWDSSASADVATYELLRAQMPDGPTISVAATLTTSVVDEGLRAGAEYRYTVRAIDAAGNVSAESEPTFVTPGADVTPPVANAGRDMSVTVGSNVIFDGSGSSDDHGIVDWQWDFGDETASGITATHAYSNPGTYTVTLTVTDVGGNSHTDTARIVVTAFTGDNLVVTVTEEGKTTRLAGAYVAVETQNGTRLIETTDANGVAGFEVGVGLVTVRAFASGYLPPEPLTPTVTDSGATDLAVALRKGEMLVSDVTVERMTPQEIVDAGIDITDPANQWTSSFSITWEGRALTGIVPAVQSSGGLGLPIVSSGGGSSGGGGFALTYEVKLVDGVPAMSHVLVAAEASWLKEFFDTTLVVSNISPDPTFEVVDTVATLRPGSGLSLAPVVPPAPAETPVKTLGTLRPGDSRSATWHLRGDTEGDHPIEVDVTGSLEPFGIPLSATFAASPVHVYGPNALVMYVDAPEDVTAGETFLVNVTLANTTQVPVYLARLRLTELENAQLVSGAPERYWEVLAPGQVVNESWAFVALISGHISSMETQGNVVIRLRDGTGLEIEVEPSSIYTRNGQDHEFTAAVTAHFDQTGTVTLSAKDVPSGMQVDFVSGSFTLTPGTPSKVAGYVRIPGEVPYGRRQVDIQASYDSSEATAALTLKHGMIPLDGDESVTVHKPAASDPARIMRGGTILRYFKITDSAEDGDFIPDWDAGTAAATLDDHESASREKQLTLERVAGADELIGVPIPADDVAGTSLPSVFDVQIDGFHIGEWVYETPEPVDFSGIVEPRTFDRTWKLGRTLGAGIGVGAEGVGKVQIKGEQGVTSSLALTHSSETAGREPVAYGIDVLDKVGIEGTVGFSSQDLVVAEFTGPSLTAGGGLETMTSRAFVYDDPYTDSIQQKEMALLSLENIALSSPTPIVRSIIQWVAQPASYLSTHRKKTGAGMGMYGDFSGSLFTLGFPKWKPSENTTITDTSASAFNLSVSKETYADFSNHAARYSRSGAEEVSLGIVTVYDWDFDGLKIKLPAGIYQKSFFPIAGVQKYASFRMELFSEVRDVSHPCRLEAVFLDETGAVRSVLRVEGKDNVATMLSEPQTYALSAALIPGIEIDSINSALAWSDDAIDRFLTVLLTTADQRDVPVTFEHVRSTDVKALKLKPSIQVAVGPAVSLSAGIDYRNATEYLAETGQIYQGVPLEFERYEDDDYLVPSQDSQDVTVVFDSAWEGIKSIVEDNIIGGLTSLVADEDYSVTTPAGASGSRVSEGSPRTAAGAVIRSTATLIGPAGSVSQDTTISAYTFAAGGGSKETTLESGQPVHEGLALASDFHAFAPYDLILEAPATLSITYTDSQANGLDESALRVYRHDDVSGGWSPLESTVDPAANRISTTVTELGTFAVGLDTSGPVLAVLTPTPGSHTASDTPLITACIADLASGIDTASINASVDGALVGTTLDVSGTVNATAPTLSEGIHTVSLVASDMNGNASSVETTFTVDTDAPVTPSGLSSTVSAGVVRLAWEPHPETGTRFVVYRRTASDSEWVTFGTTSGTEFVDPVAIAGVTYDYALSAADPAGNESPAITVEGVQPAADAGAPGAVDDLSATETGDGVRLTWTLPLDSDLMLVRVVRTSGVWPAGPTEGELLYEGPAEEFLDTTAEPSTDYRYTVYALDYSRNWSNPTGVSITTLEADTLAPTTAVTGTPTGWVRERVTLTFEATDNRSTPVIRYRVSNGTTETVDGPLIIDTDGETTVTYWAEDEAGNTETPRSLTVRIDRTAPRASTSAPARMADGTTIEVVGTDSHSGIAGIELEVDGTALPPVAAARATCTPVGYGPHTLRFRAVDVAGNSSAWETHAFTVFPDDLTVTPLQGADRYATSIAVSERAFPEGADTIVIASGANWPDALGGSALAGALDGPVLLTKPDSLPDGLTNELKRLGAEHAVVLGGTSAVSDTVATQLAQTLGAGSVRRIGGGNRYETAALIAQATKDALADAGTPFDGRVLIATGKSFPDALAASPLAAAGGRPILLAMPDEAPAATLHALRAVGATDALLLGGTGALSNDVAVQLSSAGIATSRIGGADRYETARLLAEEAIEAVGLQWSGVSIATGANFPDALAGGVLQAKTGSVILLTKSSTLSESAASALAENSDLIGEVRFLGGQAALSADVREQVIAALGW